MKIYIAKRRGSKKYFKSSDSALKEFKYEDGWVLKAGTNFDGSSELIFIKPGEYGIIKTVELED